MQKIQRITVASQESWCSYNRDRVICQNIHKPVQNYLSKAGVESKAQFFSSVASCRTQNVSESFHHLLCQFEMSDPSGLLPAQS